MRLLDLYCKAGGAAMGYHLAGFTEIVGVDIEKQPHYPFTFVQADALDYVIKHGHEFDVIHASPQCQGYSRCTPNAYKANHPRMIGQVRDMLIKTGKPYVIENVNEARSDMINPIMLCGSMVGLNLWRHRYFEIEGAWFLTPPCNHGKEPVLLSGVFRRQGYRREHTAAEKREASGLWWMTVAEMDEAIPPAFTEYIGRQLLSQMVMKRVV